MADNGTGVPHAIAGTLFDPFVSLGKPNGTGLGLAIVNKIVQDHGGSVTLEKTSESGTTFLVKLPPIRRKSAPTRPKSGRLGPYRPVSAETAESGRNSKKKKKKKRCKRTVLLT